MERGDCRGGLPKERLDPEQRQKIVVGLTMVFVEMVQVTRCYNCNGLGHIARSCKQKPKCHKCGKEGHKIKECRAEKSECGNCK
jgi:hypothetical protein